MDMINKGNNKKPKRKISDDDYEEIELPKWVVDDIPSQKQGDLPSLNEQPPTYPKETNNNAEAEKAVEDVIKRTLSRGSIAENFFKVTSVEVLEEQEQKTSSSWCTAPGSNSKIPECFRLEFFIDEKNNNKIHLHLTGTTRIMATKGFYHVLKYYLDSSVMWGAGRSGINLNQELVIDKLSSTAISDDDFWREILLNRMGLTSSSSTTNTELLKLFGTDFLVRNNQKKPSSTSPKEDEHQREEEVSSILSSSTSSEYFSAETKRVQIVHSAHTPLRYNYNLCTFAYTMSWWEWPEWEMEIDWMALHGINMPLALVGQEAVWLKLWTEVLFPPPPPSESDNNKNTQNASSSRFFVSQRDVLQNHFTGAAFWPWHWMGNLRRWAGPVSLEYVNKRMILQKKILNRMRELKMFFTLPAFAGHVPEQVGRILSDWFAEELPPEGNDRTGGVEIMSPSEWINSFLKNSLVEKLLKGGNNNDGGDQNKNNNNGKDEDDNNDDDVVMSSRVSKSGGRIIRRRKRNSNNKQNHLRQADHIRRSALWMAFDSKSSGVVTLSPSHPLFAKISYYFMQTLTDMYGTAHFYSADQFNEMPPPTLHPQFLAESGRAVVDGIQRVNPHGRWVVQGWLFLHHHQIWRKTSVKSYLDGAGKGNVVVLDLASDIRDLILVHDHFYGHDHIWCLLHNFGGRRGIFGHMPMIVEKMTHASYFQILKGNRENKNLVGFGLTMEATHHNPAFYELTTDLMFSDSFVNGGKHNNNNNEKSSLSSSASSSLILSKLISSFPATSRDFAIQQEDDSDAQSTRPFRKHSLSLLQIWWTSFIRYRYNHNNNIMYHKNVVIDNNAAPSSVALSSTVIFSRLSAHNGPYSHPHDCCPSFSLIPFLPLVFSTVSSYGMNRGTDLDTRYRPDSLFGAASWLLSSLSKSSSPSAKRRNLDTTIYDAIDYTRQVIDTVFYEIHGSFQLLLTLCSISFNIAAKNSNNNNLKHCVLRDDIKHVADRMLEIIESLDELGCASSNFDLYKNWLQPAMKNWADDNEKEKGVDTDLYNFIHVLNDENKVLTSQDEVDHDTYNEKEFKNYWKRATSSSSKIIKFSKSDALFNAKNLITAWGDSRGQGYPNYAGRSWCGMYKRVYSKRWRRLLEWIQREVDAGTFMNILGVSGPVRQEIMKLDWNFCVDHRKDIQRFVKEEQSIENGKNNEREHQQQDDSIKSILSVASRWLKNPSEKNNNGDDRTAWIDETPSKILTATDFELLSSSSSSFSCPHISLKALRDAALLTQRGTIAIMNEDNNNFYILRQAQAWTSHPVATAAVCRAMKNCVGIDTYGGIYMASSVKVFQEKVCSSSSAAAAAVEGDSPDNKLLPKDRLFYVIKRSS